MNKFAKSWKENQERVFTENGGVTFDTSANSNVDLFFKIGAMRGQPVERLYAAFAKAFGENPYIATRILLWARDARGGAGERKIFRDLLVWLEDNNKDVLRLVIPKIPEIGRWDDLLVFKTKEFQREAYSLIGAAIKAKNGLCAKWLPRKGPIANDLRKYFGVTPKEYRKVLVSLTDVVEQKMCAKDWESINYEHIPSVAQARYSKAFLRHDELRYRDFGNKAKIYAEAVATGDADVIASVEKVKINAGAVYPYDVLKTLTARSSYSYGRTTAAADLNVIRAQWATLPNYMGEKSILPLVDVSGSMSTARITGSDFTAMDVAVSLGLYMATKNKGSFHNMFMTFSTHPELVTLKGEDVVNHVQQLMTAKWDMSTNIEAAFQRILRHAVDNNVPHADMPEYLVVLSDMEFDSASQNRGATAFENAKILFERAGYKLPQIVWWNIQSRGDSNVPVKFNQSGAALVSGFSPTITKNIMSGKGTNPYDMMMDVIMDPRYDLDLVKAA